MKELKFPLCGITKELKQILELYHNSLDFKSMTIYSETDMHQSIRNGDICREPSKCIPRFLSERYEPFQYIEDLSPTSSDSIYSMLYIPIREFYRECQIPPRIGLDETIFVYNKAFGIALHALNAVCRPCEYFERYFNDASLDNYLKRSTVMGIVYNLLSVCIQDVYMDIFLQDIRKELEKDAPYFLDIQKNKDKEEYKASDTNNLHEDESATHKSANEGEDARQEIPQDVKSCFKHPSEFTKEQVKKIVDNFYLGIPVNLALIEVVLFDHGQLHKRNRHKAFIRALKGWGILREDTDEGLTSNSMSTKLKRPFPMTGYKEWENRYLNDRTFCTDIGNMLDNSMRYGR